MSVRGTIAVDVAFTDSTTTAGGSSLNTITLRDATEYTTGKVSIVSGTVGTASTIVPISSAGYVDSSGTPVSFAQVHRLALVSSDSVGVVLDCQESGAKLQSRNGNIATSHLVYEPSDTPSNERFDLTRKAIAGTAFYTLVIYGT
jgi:hypothetical protein